MGMAINPEDEPRAKEIDRLAAENARLRADVERLKAPPEESLIVESLKTLNTIRTGFGGDVLRDFDRAINTFIGLVVENRRLVKEVERLKKFATTADVADPNYVDTTLGRMP